MKIRMAVAVLAVTASACSGMKGATPALQPLGREGEVHVYALSLPRDADRLSFTIAGIAMLRQGGGEVPLQLLEREIAGAGWAQRPLASGRLAPGDYVGVSVHVGAASIRRDGESARLLVDPEPTRASLAFRVEAGEAVVVWLRLGQGSLRGDFAFAPGFTATLPPQTPPQVALYCTNTGSASVTAVDRRARLVTGVVPVGAEPRGIALDRAGRRAYVALSREDQLEIIDLAAGAPVGRIRLSPGDGPGDVALAADGTLVVVNVRSRSVSFVDPLAMSEVARVPVGDAPSALLVDRSGRRAYVANRGAGTVTVVDVANRAVAGTVATDPEPRWMQLSRDGSRLYVVHRGSADLTVFDVPSLAPVARAYVGLGATTMKVDPRTDLIYLSHGDDRRISVYDPVSLQPIDRFDVPGSVSHMTIDDAENTLLALVPERRAIAVFDLTSRKLLAEIPVGAAPYAVAFAGERF